MANGDKFRIYLIRLFQTEKDMIYEAHKANNNSICVINYETCLTVLTSNILVLLVNILTSGLS